jgi:hypothetical protein
LFVLLCCRTAAGADAVLLPGGVGPLAIAYASASINLQGHKWVCKTTGKFIVHNEMERVVFHFILCTEGAAALTLASVCNNTT